jgi:AcrR family transcriptional regulator
MGHRELLLDGAKRCIYEKGYAQTTARDIVAASGTNLGSIGYHYGSTEALLTAALMEAIEDWSDELERALAADPHTGGTPVERFEATWARIIESFSRHRQLWAASFDAFSLIERLPEVRAVFAEGMQQARPGLAALFGGVEESTIDERTSRTVGALYHALMSGVMVQWLVDPDHAPSARDLADGLRAIAASAMES